MRINWKTNCSPAPIKISKTRIFGQSLPRSRGSNHRGSTITRCSEHWKTTTAVPPGPNGVQCPTRASSSSLKSKRISFRSFSSFGSGPRCVVIVTNAASRSLATFRSSWPMTHPTSGRIPSSSSSTRMGSRSSWRVCLPTTSARPGSCGETLCVTGSECKRTVSSGGSHACERSLRWSTSRVSIISGALPLVGRSRLETKPRNVASGLKPPDANCSAPFVSS